MGFCAATTCRRAPTARSSPRSRVPASPSTRGTTARSPRAQIWLREEARKYRDRPWVLFVSFVAPHFPLTAPPHLLPLSVRAHPDAEALSGKNLHPYVRDQAENTGYDKYFEDEAAVKRARAGYFGPCPRWMRTSAICSARWKK